MKGALVCRMHGGSSPQAKAKAKQRRAVGEAVREVARLGGAIDVQPLDALVGLVREAAANVQVYRMVVGRLIPDIDRDGIVLPAIEGEYVTIPERENVLVKIYDAERDRLARYSKLCLDAGVDERRVRIAEAQGQALARVVDAAVTAALSAMAAGVTGTLEEPAVRALVDGARRAAIGAADEALRGIDVGDPLAVVS
jgi:hypothetical protein